MGSQKKTAARAPRKPRKVETEFLTLGWDSHRPSEPFIMLPRSYVVDFKECALIGRWFTQAAAWKRAQKKRGAR